MFGPPQSGPRPRVLDEEESELIAILSFLAMAIAGRGEYPRRTGENKQGLRDPPGNYDLSCSINTSKNCKNCGRRLNLVFPQVISEST